MKLFILILILLQIEFAQVKTGGERVINTFTQIYNGLSQSLELYDIPIGALYLSRHAINKSNFGDFITVSPTSFEVSFSKSVGENGHVSLGSMDKDILPHSIFLSRIGVNILLDIFTQRKITSTPYKNAFLFQKSLIYTYTLTELTKQLIKRERPDNSDDRSFFSGHTSTTFAAATYLYLEMNELYTGSDFFRQNIVLQKTAQVLTFSTLFGWAGYVGYSRIRDNKHYLSDVITGASIGILVSYLVHKHYNVADEESGDLQIYSSKQGLQLTFCMKF